MTESLVAVLDVGKTMAKLTLWTSTGKLVAREVRANARIAAGEYAALDTDGIEFWMAETLSSFSRRGRIGAIVPVAHGAAATVVRNGRLVAPPIDYEEPMNADERIAYELERGAFAETGSPSLPDGLNLGAQLHRLEKLHPGLLSGDAVILMWPQYWAWRLSNVAASEVTSLGCHTDLWDPVEAAPSTLARRRGWADRLPPLRPAAAALGPVSEEWRERCGLGKNVIVHCGLHDSNAALVAARGYPEIADYESTVLSTGTWFVAMRSPAPGTIVDPASLSEARDCLVNVDAYGKPVPSSRFMGGREIEQLIGLDTRRIDIRPDQPGLLAAVPRVLADGVFLLPTFAAGFGPFPDCRGCWVNEPTDPFVRRAAVSLYAALVADTSLDLIGSRDRIVVEGRFAEAEVFVRGLASLRPATAIHRANAHNDVSFGALRLLFPTLRPDDALERVEPLPAELEEYRNAWRSAVDQMESGA